MTDLGTLKIVPLREVFPNEARDFTPYLADHLGELGNVLNLDLERAESEVSVGAFAADLVAEESNRGRAPCSCTCLVT